VTSRRTNRNFGIRGRLTKTVGWREITARKKGVCGVCGRTFKRGGRVMFIARGSACRHLDCHRRGRMEDNE
jgi:hypothetical protein